MSTIADNAITTLRAIHSELAARVAGFTDDDLARTSGSVDWSVAQVLSHLGSGAEIFLATLRSATSGGEVPDQDFNASVWARWDAMGRRAQAEAFLDSDERLVGALEALDPAAREAVQVHLDFLPAPADIDTLTGMRLNEAALHAWDVRVAFDPAATLTPQEADAELDELTGPISFMVGFLGKGPTPDGTELTLRVETTDPERVLGLVLGQRCSLEEAPEQADGVLSGPAEAVVRLLAGRLSPAHTPDTVSVTGARTLDQLRLVFPGS